MASDDVIDRLLTQLNTSQTCQIDKSLNQVIKQLITELKKLSVNLAATTSGGSSGGVINNSYETKIVNPFNNLLFGNNEMNRFYIPSGDSSSGSSGDDYVVLSDGGLPVPEPVNDGAGNFIYIPYIP